MKLIINYFLSYCEKWQLITSHVGRRSFATNYNAKYTTAFLLSQTGHTTERAFLEYIGKGRIDFISQFLDMLYSEKFQN